MLILVGISFYFNVFIFSLGFTVSGADNVFKDDWLLKIDVGVSRMTYLNQVYPHVLKAEQHHRFPKTPSLKRGMQVLLSNRYT